MIVRADFGRGLAYQTHSFYTHLEPDVTVVVSNKRIDPGRKWPETPEAYPDGIVTTWAGYTADFDNPDALDALSTCDVVYSAETYYDERLPQIVNTVLHVNPEFWRHQPATQYWYPTTWRMADLPPGHLVPTPVDDERIAKQTPGQGRVLHVAGHRATADRNGTQIVTSILNQTKDEWRITTQDGLKLSPVVLGHVEVCGFGEDNWAMYDGCGVMVYPRRYGGQSLQVNEAMARGLAVVMSDCEPNIATWPVIPAPTRTGGWVQTPSGRVPMSMTLTGPLMDILTTLRIDAEMLERWQWRSLLWARDNAWSLWKPKIERLLEDAAS